MVRVRNRLRDQRGFTLTELLLTVTVFGILMAIAVPSISLQIARQELDASARELTEVLRGARDAAINEGVPRYVLLVPGTPARYQVYRFDGTAWVTDRNRVPLKGSVGFSADDVTVPAVADAPIAGVSVPADAVYFDTRGRYPSGYGGSYTITLRPRTGDPLSLRVYPQTGQVTEG